MRGRDLDYGDRISGVACSGEDVEGGEGELHGGGVGLRNLAELESCDF